MKMLNQNQSPLNKLSMNFSNINTNASINQLLDGFFNSTIGDFIGSDVLATHPRVNIIEKDNHYEIDLAAPGLQKNDFIISLENSILKIEVKKEQEESDKTKYRRREYTITSFTRSFTLPKDLDMQNIEATYVDGILKLHIAKMKEKKPSVTKIEIG